MRGLKPDPDNPYCLIQNSAAAGDLSRPTKASKRAESFPNLRNQASGWRILWTNLNPEAPSCILLFPCCIRFRGRRNAFLSDSFPDHTAAFLFDIQHSAPPDAFLLFHLTSRPAEHTLERQLSRFPPDASLFPHSNTTSRSRIRPAEKSSETFLNP